MNNSNPIIDSHYGVLFFSNKAIRELDNNKYPLNHYMGFGWDGLRAYDYQGLLTPEESNELYHLQAIVNDNTNFNPTNCN